MRPEEERETAKFFFQRFRLSLVIGIKKKKVEEFMSQFSQINSTRYDDQENYL